MKKIKFISSNEIVADDTIFVAKMKGQVSTKEALLGALSEILNMPGYFGFNWDALSDCLSDFHWIKQKKIVLIHENIPNLSASDLNIYLEVLIDAIDSWANDDKHEFIVIFPESSEILINALLVERVN